MLLGKVDLFHLEQRTLSPSPPSPNDHRLIELESCPYTPYAVLAQTFPFV